MPIVLTREALARLFPRARAELRERIHASQEAELARFGINRTARRLAYFLAQAAEESGGFTVFAENLSYTAKRMSEVWPSRFPTLASARPYERNPQRLANKVYGGRMGNGSEASGDGWRYRGRGPIQLTGRDNYETVGAVVGLDLIANPELALTPEHMMLIQAGYWAKNNLNRFADHSDFVGLTKAVNGGLTNLALRQEWLRKVEAELARPGSVLSGLPDSAPAAPPPDVGPRQVPPPAPILPPGGWITRLLRHIASLFARTA